MLAGRLTRAVLTGTGLLVLGALLAPGHACAIQVAPIGADVLDYAQLEVKVASSDPTGTLVLSVDGELLDARPVAPGDTIKYPKMRLHAGRRTAIAMLRTREGLRLSKPTSFNVWTKPEPAVLVTPSSYAARLTETTVEVGESTTVLSLYVNDVLKNTRIVAAGTFASMGAIELAQGANEIVIVASNPLSSTRSRFVVTRLDFPWPTCIVIDKSEFKLYWVKDGALVKTYPIAIGKPSTPTPSATWRIDAKYYTDPASVYGPRKMRLFRQTSSGYAYTAYGIHGTNQPWVIGTMASHGCIRMYNADALDLFPQVPLGTMVQTRP